MPDHLFANNLNIFHLSFHVIFDISDNHLHVIAAEASIANILIRFTAVRFDSHLKRLE